MSSISLSIDEVEAMYRNLSLSTIGTVSAPAKTAMAALDQPVLFRVSDINDHYGTLSEIENGYATKDFVDFVDPAMFFPPQPAFDDYQEVQFPNYGVAPVACSSVIENPPIPATGYAGDAFAGIKGLYNGEGLVSTYVTQTTPSYLCGPIRSIGPDDLITLILVKKPFVNFDNKENELVNSLQALDITAEHFMPNNVQHPYTRSRTNSGSSTSSSNSSVYRKHSLAAPRRSSKKAQRILGVDLNVNNSPTSTVFPELYGDYESLEANRAHKKRQFRRSNGNEEDVGLRQLDFDASHSRTPTANDMEALKKMDMASGKTQSNHSSIYTNNQPVNFGIPILTRAANELCKPFTVSTTRANVNLQNPTSVSPTTTKRSKIIANAGRRTEALRRATKKQFRINRAESSSPEFMCVDARAVSENATRQKLAKRLEEKMEMREIMGKMGGLSLEMDTRTRTRVSVKSTPDYGVRRNEKSTKRIRDLMAKMKMHKGNQGEAMDFSD